MDAISRRVTDSDPPRDSISTDVSQADLLLVAPLSHETLAEIACGIVLDLLTEIVRSWEYRRRTDFQDWVWRSPARRRASTPHLRRAAC